MKAKVELQPEGVHAVFAVDPGNTSGIAAGYVELQPTLKETLLGISSRKSAELKGSWLYQGREIARLMKRFVYTANVEQSMRMDRIHLVFEDFVLRMPAVTTNLSSVWIAASAVTSFNNDAYEIDWQQPSSAKSKATNERLKGWGLWEVGSEHKRDAWRHFALRVDKLISAV